MPSRDSTHATQTAASLPDAAAATAGDEAMESTAESRWLTVSRLPPES
jgi:hypothetical protein